MIPKMAKKAEAIAPIETPTKKGCGCNGDHGAGFEAPEPYTHDGKEYLFKSYTVNNPTNGDQLPAKQVFKLAAGDTLCDDCLEDFPILGTIITPERTDNGTAKMIVDRLFAIQSTLLSVIE
jgi:hypothetical protein